MFLFQSNLEMETYKYIVYADKNIRYNSTEL